MKQFALELTGQYRASNTRLVAYTTSSAAALWNMRWQVRGFVAENPDATEAEVFGRFSAGSGLRAGNLRGIFEDNTWEAHLAQFGETLLLTAFARYEGWAHGFAQAATSDQNQRRAVSSTLTSDRPKPATQKKGMKALRGTPSAFAAAQFRSSLQGRPHVRPMSQLPDLLKVARGFKTVRNALIHSNGVLDGASQKLVAAAASVPAASIGTKRSPLLPATSSDGAEVTYASAIFCTEVLLKIVTSVDAEVGGSTACETDILRRVRSHPNIKKWRLLPADPDKRSTRVSLILRQVGAPDAQDPLAVAGWLKEHGVVSY